MYGGVRLDSDPPPSAERVAGVFRALVERAGAAGLDLDHDERAELATWLGIGRHLPRITRTTSSARRIDGRRSTGEGWDQVRLYWSGARPRPL